MLSLHGFVATLQPDANFGRILAAYGGVFVAGSLAWGMVVDGFRPDRHGVAGALICLLGVSVIMYAPDAGFIAHYRPRHRLLRVLAPARPCTGTLPSIPRSQRRSSGLTLWAAIVSVGDEPRGGLRASTHPQLREHVADVVGDGLPAEEEPFGNLRVGQPVGNQ